MTTLFFIEHANGQVSDQSLKAISATSQIDGDVHGLIVGSNIDSAVAEASKIEGLTKLIHVDDDNFTRTNARSRVYR
jgi:electron transfer flavoprotein alpha subunit